VRYYVFFLSLPPASPPRRPVQQQARNVARFVNARYALRVDEDPFSPSAGKSRYFGTSLDLTLTRWLALSPATETEPTICAEYVRHVRALR